MTSQSRQRILLTGATGYLGTHLRLRLAHRGFQVLALARPPRRGTLMRHPNVEWLLADLRDSDNVAAAARRSDAVVHAAAEHNGSMREVDQLALDAIVEGLSRSGKPLLWTSATVVYGDTGLVPRSEADPIVAPLPARAWRAVHDRRVAGLASQGICGIVIRPPTIYGAGDGVIRRRIDTARQTGIAAYVGDGAAVWSTVHIDDLIDLFLLCLSRADASGIYNAASADRMSRRALAETIAAAFGPGIEARSVDLATAAAELGDLAAMGTINQLISSARAREELGWRPHRVSLGEDLRCGSYQALSFPHCEEFA